MGQKILVVEDNELNLKLFCDLLRAHGYEAEPVRDGREAVARARSFAPDLVVMDIQMPWISGLELIEQMKGDAELKRTPIMAVTAYAAKGDEERIREAGAEGYVSKPISLMRFIEAVRGLLTAAEEAAAAEAAEAEVEEEPTDDPTRHSRESGNPEDLFTRTDTSEGALDSRFRGNDGEGGDEAAEIEAEPADDQSRHSRESGNPEDLLTRTDASEGALDSRFRGNDGEGDDAPEPTHTETAGDAPPERAGPAVEDPGEPARAPDGDAPEGARVT